MATLSPRRRWILLGAAVVVATFAWLIYGGLNRNVVFFLTPKELLAKGNAAVDVPVRLGGQVKPGSVKWDEKSLALHFAVTDGAGEIAAGCVGVSGSARCTCTCRRRSWRP